MNDASQFTVALRIGLAGLPRRWGSSLVIVASVACTIGVLVSILALSTGLKQAWTRGGSDRVAVVLGRDAAFVYESTLTRADIAAVADTPGIARDTVDGAPVVLASGEFRAQLPPVPRAADGSIQVRGIPPVGINSTIRPAFRIESGRMFRPGAQELIIGVGIARAHGAHIGATMLMPDGEWPIVGTFSDGGSITESDLMGDADTLAASLRRDAFSHVLVALEDPDAFDRFANALRTNSALRVSIERQSDFLARVGGDAARYFSALAWSVGLVMTVGALFACVKILYASVSVRTQEMATLRALGYARVPVAASVLAEGVVLAVIGAVLGGAVAWLLFDGRYAADYNRMFTMAVTPGLLIAGIGWAAVPALIGGLVPALRAARLQVVEGLRQV